MEDNPKIVINYKKSSWENILKTKKDSKKVAKRGFIRYNPDKNTLGLICFHPELEEFRPDFVSLVANESYSGCCVVMIDNPGMKEGKEVLIRCGNLPVVKGTIRWVKHLDEIAIKVGIEFTTDDL
jgi:hypothetical protein